MPFRFPAWTLAIVAVSAAAICSRGDEPPRPSTDRETAPPPSAVDDDGRTIPLDAVPAPTELADLIQRGRVRLLTGGAPQSEAATLAMRGRLAGETRFRFRYRYDSRARWRLLPENGQAAASGRRVQLNVRFRTLEWIAEHDIWLRSPPESKDFWNDAVLRHEFDHVRLSTSTPIEAQFMKAVQRLHSIRVPFERVASDGRVDPAKVQSLIESHVNEALRNTSDYVRLRYRELDRLTEHGLRPLPEQANLIEND